MEFEEALNTAIDSCGVQLYDTKVGKVDKTTTYTIFIYHKDGISLDKCSEVSRAVSPLFDIYEPVTGNWTLQVSSPGIERILKTLTNFKQSIGEYVKIKTKELEKYQGTLQAVQDDIIKLKFKDKDIQIVFDNILKAQTIVRW